MSVSVLYIIAQELQHNPIAYTLVSLIPYVIPKKSPEIKTLFICEEQI